MKIDIKTITDKQKLTIEKGLCDYKYIMSHLEKKDADFKNVYYEFYLKARWAVMSNIHCKNVYFSKLFSITGKEKFMDVLNDLSNAMGKGTLEFSIATKLLHTKNPDKPIYDSKVREYLSREEGVDFWWNHKRNISGKTEEEKIEHDWNSLNDWYKGFLSSNRGKEWISWFDKCFPSFKNISDVKKIDFIIFACN